jgi:hypothetical protein
VSKAPARLAGAKADLFAEDGEEEEVVCEGAVEAVDPYAHITLSNEMLNRFPPANCDSYILNVHWTANYYFNGFAGSRADRGYDDPLERHPESGASLHGYAFNEELNMHEFASTVHPLPNILT